MKQNAERIEFATSLTKTHKHNNSNNISSCNTISSSNNNNNNNNNNFNCTSRINRMQKELNLQQA
jgi:hypothetical protein